MNLKLIGNRVLLKPMEKPTLSEGGLYLGDSGEKPQIAKVIAVGPGKKNIKLITKVGDSIMHGKYAGTEIEIDKITYLIMDESDILIILGDENEDEK